MKHAFQTVFFFCSSTLFTVAISSGQVVEEHLANNPVLRDLIEPSDTNMNGLDHGVTLRPPAIPDGLSELEQLAEIDKFLEKNFPRESFLRGKISDPSKIVNKFPRDTPDDYRLSVVDVYFVSRGNLEIFSNREFLESLLATDDKKEEEDKVSELTTQQLASVGISADSIDDKREAYRIVDTKLMDTVALKGVSRTYWTQTKESIVLAIALDKRFDEDQTLKARWEKLIQLDNGDFQVDQEGSSYCIGIYLKITPLKGLEEKVLIEGHGVIIQPKVWFRGRNSIGDKLSSLIDGRISDIRRKIKAELNE